MQHANCLEQNLVYTKYPMLVFPWGLGPILFLSFITQGLWKHKNGWVSDIQCCKSFFQKSKKQQKGKHIPSKDRSFYCQGEIN